MQSILNVERKAYLLYSKINEVLFVYLFNLKENDLEKTLDLFCECFVADHYYRQMFQDNNNDLSIAMHDEFKDSISFCIKHGIGIGVTDDNDDLIAFALLFNYKEAKQNAPDYFNKIFGFSNVAELPYVETLHKRIEKLQGEVLYLLSIAVSFKYRNCGLASGIIDYILATHSEYSLVSDISNINSLGIYKKRNFQIKEIDDNYFYVMHEKGESSDSVDFSQKLKLVVPNHKIFDAYGIEYNIEKECKFLIGYKIEKCEGVEIFVNEESSIAVGELLEINYFELLKYQRLINVSNVYERTSGDVLFYEHIVAYSEPPLLNDVLSEMVETRSTEWSLVPDVFVSIPMKYSNPVLFDGLNTDLVANSLLDYMNFRTCYEAGVSAEQGKAVDDLSELKKRIKRFYLEKLKIQVYSETNPNFDMRAEKIGPAALVDLYISIDSKSNCSVLTLYSLSSPFLVSHLFDSVIRNQLMVVDENNDVVNFYAYINRKYDLLKTGTPKIYAIFPYHRTVLSQSQLASLLAGETIYPDGEEFGRIVDEDILKIVKSRYGMGQYDRAFVCAYSNVVLQFSMNFSGRILDRLLEESITLFYIELILFEEAAIRIADRRIISLYTENKAETPIDFLEKVDLIYDDYSKTIAFWDVRVNYPTSQKSITMLRDAFGIKSEIEEMKRNQEQLQITFDVKCDIIDRKDSKRMDTSLAIISVLAVFSAWIDGHDYIATWNDAFPDSVIYIMQKVLFLLVLITACYAVAHLFGNKIALLLKKRRVKSYGKRKKRRW